MDVLPVPSPKRASRAHTQKLAITLSPKHVKSAATDVQLSRLNGGIPVGIVPRERAPSPHVAKGIIVGGSGDLTPIILHNALQRRLGHAVIPPSLPPKLPPRIGQVGVRTSSSQHGNAYNGRLSRARSDSMHDYMNGRSQSDGTVGGSWRSHCASLVCSDGVPGVCASEFILKCELYWFEAIRTYQC